LKGWRRLAAINARAGVLIGAGLTIRALMAQAMFWISYLHLPIARSFQDGDGFWTLAVDGRAYFGYANHLLANGWTAVALVDKTLPSPAFLQILAVFQFLFGGAASVGALLNLFAYLGACVAILHLGRREEGGLARSAVVAIAALSFAPAVILWSVQPLKDPLFLFAVAAFVAACTMWQEAWLGRPSAARFLPPLLLMLIVLYAVAGIRWYFGLLFWLASAPYFAILAWRSDRRVAAAVTNAALFLALSQVIVFVARPYVSQQLLFHFGEAAPRARPSLTSMVMNSRRGFDNARGNSMIAAGDILQKVDHQTPAAKEPVRIAYKPPHPKTTQPLPALIVASLPVHETNAAPASASDALPVPMSSAEETAASATTPNPQEHSIAASKESSKPSPAPEETGRHEHHQITSPTHAAPTPAPQPAAKPAAVKPVDAKPSPAPARPAVHVATPPQRVTAKRVATPPLHPQPVAKRVAKPVQTPVVVAARKAVAVPKPAAVQPRQEVLPQSTFSRIMAGLTAMIVPHFIAERLGLIHVGGGQGLWAIVETDTLIFDALLIVVLFYGFRGLSRGAWRNPSFWLVVMTTAGITVLLAYTISNFGTLFRHRSMIFTGLCLLLVVTTETRAASEPLQPDRIVGQ
jgi:hypothetical protein